VQQVPLVSITIWYFQNLCLVRANNLFNAMLVCEKLHVICRPYLQLHLRVLEISLFSSEERKMCEHTKRQSYMQIRCV
jgi:hypothetical protein